MEGWRMVSCRAMPWFLVILLGTAGGKPPPKESPSILQPWQPMKDALQKDDIGNMRWKRDAELTSSIICNKESYDYKCTCFEASNSENENEMCCNDVASKSEQENTNIMAMKDMTLSDYNTAFENKLKDIVSTLISDYCIRTPTTCGIQSIQGLSTLANLTDVIIVSVMNKDSSGSQNVINDLQIVFLVYLTPDGSDSIISLDTGEAMVYRYLIPSSVLFYVLGDGISVLHSDLHDDISISRSNQTVIDRSCGWDGATVPTSGEQFTKAQLVWICIGSIFGFFFVICLILSIIKAVK